MDELLEWMDYIEDKRQQTKVLPSQSVHEKETICNQYEPSRVFGTGIKFLKTRYFEKEEGKQFMRMSWGNEKIPCNRGLSVLYCVSCVS